MTQALDTAIAAVDDALAGIQDPVRRNDAMREAEAKLSEVFKRHRRGVANDLYAQGKKWREVGETLGGVSAQRAWQISRGE
ncbi:hypothetical protein [Streptomyces althioticus]|jgi:hypothetical protein|uniref:hypothetical protein n=1 Tax=Streptomyces althioticus TaxID=83380 RepID=UPI0033CE6120